MVKDSLQEQVVPSILVFVGGQRDEKQFVGNGGNEMGMGGFLWLQIYGGNRGCSFRFVGCVVLESRSLLLREGHFDEVWVSVVNW